MRALLAPVLLVLALLVGGAGGGQTVLGPASHALRSGARGDRDGIVSRGTADALPLLTAGRQTKRGHGATPAPFVLPAALALALPGAAGPAALALPPGSLASTPCSSQRARAPPA